IYQVAYVVVKAANSPRPGNWILEKSIDGVKYEPWQFFASTDDDCQRVYNIPALQGKPSYDYLRDDEIFISLTNGRPGIFVPSKTLLEFTSARYVRLRMQKIRTLNADLMSLQSRDPRNLDPSVTRRYFYSIKDISIGGQCICYGHATECQRQGNSDCNCHGHANSCVYNETVDALGLSLNMQGEKKGGGVCIDCNDFTTGVNCERCMPGYFRPWGVPHNSPRPCRPCSCEESIGNTGICIEDDSRVGDGLMPGSCICREGFAGQSCDRCAAGYHSYPHCEPCSCSVKGTVDPNMCEGRCVCKENVAGEKCDRCEQGYYDLSAENAQGCRQCFCFGVSTITDMRGEMDGWTIITVNDEWFTYFPTPVAGGWLEYRTFPARDQNYVDPDGASEEVIYYWQSPVKYYGNRLASYGGSLHYTMKFTIDESAPVQNHMAEADVILQETEWYKLDSENGRYISSQHVTKKEFMLLLFDLQRILIRATHHTAQDNVMLKEVLLDTSNAGSTNEVTMSGVEKCSCPRGYTGLSCESCDIGWRRLNNVLYGGQCIPCECYGHSKTCDPYTGRCLGNPDDCKPCACPLLESSNNFATTCASSPKFDDPGAFVCLDCAVGYTGERCERCDTGYYGYPGLLGEYCKECQCNGNIDRNMLGSCDQLTGECRICLHNTEGDDCGRCRLGYYGTAMNGDCTLCSCDPFGSLDMTCDRDTGYCKCKEHYTGRQCDRCEDGFTSVNENYWGLESGQGCKPCDCDPIGSYFQQCDSIMGQCRCKHGVTGKKCDICNASRVISLVMCVIWTRGSVYARPTLRENGVNDVSTHTGGMTLGLVACGCDKDGSLDNNCDPLTGQCACAADYTGLYCDECLFGFYNFPDCSLCLCSVEGTEPESCSSSGACSCQEPEGQCQCKSNTMGRTCQQCMENSFSLDLHNPDGCTDCFCFGRAESCEQARYVWIKSELPDQSVTFSNRANTMVLRQPSGFHVIPDNVTWTRVIDTQGDPVYWKVPGLTGDMHTNHGDDFSDMEALVDKPLVVIVGYGFPIMFSVRLHEHYWRTSRNAEVGRKLMMVILKNVTDIYIRATWDNTAVGARLSDISLDQAVDNELQLGRPALGIEKCECPPKYTGLSCQDPAEGYYRVPNIGELDFTDLTGVIGDVRKCECNGHSERCHPETGVCYDCDHNTSGDNCDMCADSYYGNATQGTANACQRCACPLKRKTNNPTCVLVDNDLVCTACEMGYDVVQRVTMATPQPLVRNANPVDVTLKVQSHPSVTTGVCAFVCQAYRVKSVISVSPDMQWNRDSVCDRLQNLKYAEVLNVQEQLKNLTDEVESTHKRSEGAIIKSNQNKNDGEKLLRDATQIEDTISLREMDVKATTFHNRSGVNVTSSLIEAQRILDDIMARNFDKMSKDARKEHDEAELLSERIHGHFLQLTNTSSAEERVNHVRDAFQDLLEHVEKSVVNSEETQKKVKELRKTLDRTRMVEERLSTLEAAMGPLTEKEKLLRTELPDAATLVDKAKAHADNLTKIAENLARTFDSTRDAAADPMRAANVYNDIVAAINEAEIAAKKAKDDADNATSMMDFDELKQKVADSLQRSMDLRDEAREITDVGIAGLDDDLLQLNDNLDGISDTQLDIIERHQDIAAEIDALPTDTVDRIADVQSTIDKAEDTANRVRSDTDKMVDRVNNEMMPKLEELQGIVGGKFDDIYTTMDGTKQKIDELNNLTKGIDTRISQSSRMRSDLRDKLSKLKQSIREAREEANKVKTSLSADGKCVKKFRSMTQPGTINSISFAFKTTKPNQDMMMVLVQNQGISEGDDEKEFLAVELRDGNVRFSWNAGGGVGSVTDNKKVISETSVIKESEKWYNVKAERIGGLGRLIVHRLSEPAGAPLTNTSKVGFSLMALSEQTNVYASGVPDSVVIDKVLTKRNFSGCMGSMYIDETLGEYMALELENGHVVFKYYLGQGSLGQLQTVMKYNRNQWVSVAAARSGLMGLLEVGTEQLISEGPRGDTLLDVSKNDLYYGGIPPSVNMDVFQKASGGLVSSERFLGCMSGLQISVDSVNLWEGKSTVGVSEGCRESGLRSIGFYGSGFAEYQGVSMVAQESDLSISFSTMEPDALLLLAKNVNGDLYVDDTMVATDRLQRRFSDIAVREDGGLYLGGVPDGLKVDDQAATSKSLDGILNINQPKQYDRADIGRCAQRGGANDNGLLLPEERLASDAPANIRMAEEIPLAPVIKPTKQSKTKPEEKMASDMAVPATEGPTPCAKLDNDFKFETDAFTFGETEVSFHQVNVSRKEISRKFRISLDFRTYFQNGVLFYLSNRDHKQFLTAQLVEGNIQLVYSRKDEVKEVKLKTDASLSDGQWHSVVVDKKNQRISVYVDGDEKHERGGKIAKALKVDPPLFVGGLPDNFLPLVNDQVVATSMRGCLRNLLVENDVKTFKDSTLVSGVDRCYANVEKGAYFNKYAYGVYDFSLEIEFRTSQPKGILTAITSQNGRNAMGLELVNGQVKFKAINRGGEISIKSEYGLCDNVWHKVKVTVMENSISLQVDDGEILKDFTANDVKNMKTKSALYIGGVPDSESPEVLSTNKNFEGCLRSVKINNSPLDWFNLERSVEIQKTACPVA
ncbi:LAMA2-like protein, partial [Mya arenaria]